MSAKGKPDKKWLKHTVSELKQELSDRGLSTTGRKSELLDRLVTHEKDLTSASHIEEDLIDEDVDGDVEEDQDVTVTEENADEGNLDEENAGEDNQAEENADQQHEDEEDADEEDEDVSEVAEAIGQVINEAEQQNIAPEKKIRDEDETQSKADSLTVNMDQDIASLGDLDESKELESKVEMKVEEKIEQEDIKEEIIEEDKMEEDHIIIETVGEAEDEEFNTVIEDNIEKTTAEEVEKTEVKEEEEKKPEKPAKEYNPLPAQPMNNWLVKKYANAKRYSSLIIKPLNSMNVLGDAIVEWANRAVYFCINHERDGKGAAILNFITEKECKEAKDSLTELLGDEVKVMHLSRQMETEMHDFAYKFECPNLAQRTLIIEDCPDGVWEDQVCLLFPGAISVSQPEVTSHLHNWQKKEYKLPEDISKIFFVEYGSKQIAEKALKSESGYELDGKKLKVNTMFQYMQSYKDWLHKHEDEMRKKRREEKERRRKEEEKKATQTVFTEKERIDLCRQLKNTVAKRTKVLARNDVPWNQRLMEKDNLSAKVLDIVRKLDTDTDKRVKFGLDFPESEPLMTKHTKQTYQRLQKQKEKDAKEKRKNEKKENLKITVNSDKKREVEKKEGEEDVLIESKQGEEEEMDISENFNGSCPRCDFTCDTVEELGEHNLDEHGPEGKCPHGCEFAFPWNHMERYELHHNECHADDEYVKPKPPEQLKKNKEVKKGSNRSSRKGDKGRKQLSEFDKEMKKLEGDNRGWYSMSVNQREDLKNKNKCTQHFNKFGTVMEVHYTKTRIFVRFNSRAAVEDCMEAYWGDEAWKPEVAEVLAKYRADRKRNHSRSRSRDRRVSPRRTKRDSHGDSRRDRDRRGGRDRDSHRTNIPSLLSAPTLMPPIAAQLQQQANQQLIMQQQLQQQQQMQQQAMAQQAMLQQQQMQQQQMQAMQGRAGIAGAKTQLMMSGQSSLGGMSSGGIPSLLGNDDMSDRRSRRDRDRSPDRQAYSSRGASSYDNDGYRERDSSGGDTRDVASVLKGLTQVLSSKMEELTRLGGAGEGTMNDVLESIGGIHQSILSKSASTKQQPVIDSYSSQPDDIGYSQSNLGVGSYNSSNMSSSYGSRSGMSSQPTSLISDGQSSARSLLGNPPSSGSQQYGLLGNGTSSSSSSSMHKPVYAGPNSTQSLYRNQSHSSTSHQRRY